METEFIWIDLSTFDVGKATDFYKKVFGWKSFEESFGYIHCSLEKNLCAGLYEMPSFFQEIRMPSFWMTYISVRDVDAVAAKAKELGGKVELEETSLGGRIALIRDPAGAGFTCYEGDELGARRGFNQAGIWCWTELMVSDLDLVRDFYTTLFDWRLESESADRHSILTAAGKKIGAIQVADESVKGSKEFWAVYFAVSDIENTINAVEMAGGKRGGTYPHEYGTQALAYDSQGAAFFLLQSDKQTDQPQSTASHPVEPISKNLKWRSLIGIIAVYLIVIFEWNWAWGILFLFWVIPDLKSGVTYFIEPLERRSNPLLYWVVVLTWFALSVYLLFDAIL